MPELSKLFVTIGAKTGQFEKGMKGVSKQMKQVGIAAAAMGAAIVGSLALSVKSFVEAGDQIQKMALRTGFSTEALSELKFAAEISGASIESLEKAVKRMSTAILDAQDGLAETVRQLDRLKISVEDLQGLSPEEAFFKLANAIAELPDPLQRAAIAQRIFGRAGTELLPLLAEGAAGIQELREQARELGIVWDQEAAEAAARLNDRMTELKASFKGLQFAVAEGLIPEITTLTGGLGDLISKFSQWAQQNPVVAALASKSALAFGAISLAAGGLLLTMPGVTAAFGAFKAAAIALNVSLGVLALTIVGITAGLALIAIGVAGLVQNSQNAKRQQELEAKATELNLQLKKF